MKNDIALNLLGDRTCENCNYSSFYILDLFKCGIDLDENNGLHTMCPNEETCERWKEKK